MLLDELRPELVAKIGPRLRRTLPEWGPGPAGDRLERSLEEAAARAAEMPLDAASRYSEGRILARLGRMADAEAAYRTAIDLEPRYLDAHYALAHLLNDLDRPEEALAELDLVLKLNRTHCEAYFERAHALERLGRPDEAARARDMGHKLRLEAGSWCSSAVQQLAWDVADAEAEPRRGAEPPGGTAPEPTLSIGIEFVEKPDPADVRSQTDRVAASKQRAQASQESFLKLLWGLGIQQTDSRWFINLVSTTLTRGQLEALLRALDAQWDLYGAAVERIEMNRPLEALIQGAALTGPQVRALSDLSPVTVQAQPWSSALQVGADRVWSRGLTGAGRRVAVIDTGICDQHPDLARKVTFPPASQFRLPYVYGEAIQGGNYFYDVQLRPGLTSVAVELVTGLEFAHAQLQTGMGAAKLDLYIYEPDSNRRLAVPEQVDETDGAFSHKTYLFSPRDEGGRYRLHVHGAHVDAAGTPWRGVLFKLSATDLTTYPPEVLHFVSPTDDHCHGTHVAGIVAGTGESSNGAYRGVAPGASLVCAKVLGYEGTANEVELMQAIEWAVTQGADIINISFGTYDEFCNGDCVICKAANKAVKDYRLTVVAAAGNLGEQGAGRITCPGKAEQVITVGSCSVDGRVSAFSSRGLPGGGKPDLVAPGEGIVSCLSTRHFVSVRTGEGVVAFEPLTPLVVNSSYIGLSGTSMAAPHVAGAAALLLQADPTLPPERIKAILLDTATPLPGEPPEAQGRGLLNLEAALKAVPAVVVDAITSAQPSYPEGAGEIRLEVTLRNNQPARAFHNLFVDLALQDERGSVAWRTTLKNVDLAPGETVTRPVTWSHPQGLRPGGYLAVATVREVQVAFPVVPGGNVQVRRQVDHDFSGALPVFRYG